MKLNSRHSLIALTFGALLGTMAAAHAAALPDEQQANGISYISGGIGQSETEAIRTASHQWPLTLEFAVRNGKKSDFTADVKVAISKEAGKPAFQATSQGPFMLVKLAPGKYEVSATHRGITQRRDVDVKAGAPAKLFFLWPEAADASTK